MFGFINAIRAYFKVLPFVKEKKLTSFYTLPLIFNGALLLLYTLGFYLAIGSISDYVDETMGDYIHDTWLSFLGPLLVLFFWILLLYLSSITYQMISLLALAPFYSALAEKTFAALHNKQLDSDFSKIMRDITRGIEISLRNIVRQIIITLIVLIICTLLSPLGLIGVPIIFFVAAYYYGFSMIEYRNEVMDYDKEKRIEFVHQNRGFAIGIGYVFQIMLFVPIIGTIYAPAFAVVATILGLEKDEED